MSVEVYPTCHTRVRGHPQDGKGRVVWGTFWSKVTKWKEDASPRHPERKARDQINVDTCVSKNVNRKTKVVPKKDTLWYVNGRKTKEHLVCVGGGVGRLLR